MALNSIGPEVGWEGGEGNAKSMGSRDSYDQTPENGLNSKLALNFEICSCCCYAPLLHLAPCSGHAPVFS